MYVRVCVYVCVTQMKTQEAEVKEYITKSKSQQLDGPVGKDGLLLSEYTALVFAR